MRLIQECTLQGGEGFIENIMSVDILIFVFIVTFCLDPMI